MAPFLFKTAWWFLRYVGTSPGFGSAIAITAFYFHYTCILIFAKQFFKVLPETDGSTGPVLPGAQLQVIFLKNYKTKFPVGA